LHLHIRLFALSFKDVSKDVIEQVKKYFVLQKQRNRMTFPAIEKFGNGVTVVFHFFVVALFLNYWFRSTFSSSVFSPDPIGSKLSSLAFLTRFSL